MSSHHGIFHCGHAHVIFLFNLLNVEDS